MAIYKRCDRCGKRLSPTQRCDCSKRRYKEYKQSDVNQFYFTNDWKTKRQSAINYYFGIDIYSLYVNNIVEVGQTVHHIEPLDKNYSKRLELSNLIYLTESNHRLIHKKLEADYLDTIKTLKDIQLRFEQEYK